MFERIKSFIRSARAAMFGKQTIQNILGCEIAISSDMIEAINLWSAMARGQAPWVDDTVRSLRLEKSISKIFADVCTSEMESSVSDEKLDTLYKAAIKDLNEQLQRGLAIGSFCIKPLGIETVGVEYITGDRFIPIRFDNLGRLVDVVFLDIRKVKDSDYHIRLERHKFEGGILTITNRAYRSDSPTTIGAQIPLSCEPDWEKLPEEIRFTVPRPDFGYFRVPAYNDIDDTKCGVSIFSDAIDQIRDADVQYAGLKWEFESGERAVHVDPTAIQKKKDGTGKVARLNNRLYRAMAIDRKDSELFDVFSPEFRDEAIINGMNAYFRRVEFNVGLAYGDLSDVADVAKTATEVHASKQRKYDTVKAIEENLKDCLEDLVYALAFYNRMTGASYDFICTFGDSILTDEEAVARDMREDVAAGILKPEKYLAKKYGIPEEEALKLMPEAPVA